MSSENCKRMTDQKMPEPVKNFIRPDKPHMCTYEKSFTSFEKSPHNHVQRSVLQLNKAK